MMLLAGVNGDSIMIDTRTGDVVDTGLALRTVNLVSLVKEGDKSKLDHLKSIHLPADEEMIRRRVAEVANNASLPLSPTDYSGHTMRTVSVEAWSWISSSRMEITATDGTRVLVSNENVQADGPADGHAAFDASLSQFWSTDTAFDTASLAAKCDELRCPYSSCSASTFHASLFSVRCGGDTLWAWPTGVSLSPPSAGARRLSLTAGLNACDATRKLMQLPIAPPQARIPDAHATARTTARATACDGTHDRTNGHTCDRAHGRTPSCGRPIHIYA